MSKRTECCQQYDRECCCSAHFPEVMLGICGIDDVLEVHSVVAGEKGKGQEDDCDDGEDHDSLILRV